MAYQGQSMWPYPGTHRRSGGELYPVFNALYMLAIVPMSMCLCVSMRVAVYILAVVPVSMCLCVTVYMLAVVSMSMYLCVLQYTRFINLISKLAEHPASHREKDFILAYRTAIGGGSKLISLPDIQTDEVTGRRFVHATGTVVLHTPIVRAYVYSTPILIVSTSSHSINVNRSMSTGIFCTEKIFAIMPENLTGKCFAKNIQSQ